MKSKDNQIKPRTMETYIEQRYWLEVINKLCQTRIFKRIKVKCYNSITQSDVDLERMQRLYDSFTNGIHVSWDNYYFENGQHYYITTLGETV